VSELLAPDPAGNDRIACIVPTLWVPAASAECRKGRSSEYRQIEPMTDEFPKLFLTTMQPS
jgi:hypothetical protein